MKARIPRFNNSQMKIAHQQLQLEYAKVAEQERNNATRRTFKVMAYALWKTYGFGKVRTARAINAMTEQLEKMDKDEVAWEHLDRVVIDYLGLPFERDYTEKGKPISESELIERNNRKL